MECQLSYFKSEKMVLHSICQQIWETQQWPQNWKRSVFIPVPKKGNTKECRTVAFISYASKIMLKILQVRLQQYMNPEFSQKANIAPGTELALFTEATGALSVG